MKGPFSSEITENWILGDHIKKDRQSGARLSGVFVPHDPVTSSHRGPEI